MLSIPRIFAGFAVGETVGVGVGVTPGDGVGIGVGDAARVTGVVVATRDACNILPVATQYAKVDTTILASSTKIAVIRIFLFDLLRDCISSHLFFERGRTFFNAFSQVERETGALAAGGTLLEGKGKKRFTTLLSADDPSFSSG